MVDLASGDANDDLYDAGGVPPTPGVAMRPPPVFTGVPPSMLDEYWHLIEPVLWRAIVRTGGRHTNLTVKHGILNGEYGLFVAFDDYLMTSCRGALVCQQVHYPSGMVDMEIMLCGGDVLPDCLDCLPLIEAWAKEKGCTDSILHGRRGWSRVLRGYTETAVILRKRL